MQSPTFDVSLDDAPSDEIVDYIESELLEALGSKAAANRFGDLSVVARDRNGTLVAGLVGTTAYGWLLVKMLWVAEAKRGHGLGRHLMQIAETEARRRGCHGAWLDTSSDRARQFYAVLGYEQFGLLENSAEQQPAGHRRWFLRKSLATE
ncbi:MAG: GNAT family N-acetyltransferase [Steroidobacteraceae bacterium]